MLLLLTPLLGVCLGLSALGRLSAHLPSALALLAAGMLALGFAAHRLEAAHGRVGAAILGGALLLRLALIPLAPTLSDDVLRYLWDGKVAAAGQNPYALAPDAAELAPLRDELWRRLPHRAIPTVYPPLAVGSFSIAARLPFPLAVWKALATVADLVACALLVLLARRLGVPEARAAWYAWNPLVALEVAGMGHVEPLGVAAAVGAVLLLLARRPRRPIAAGAAAAAGALVKLAPLVAVPLWGRAAGGGRQGLRLWGTALVLFALACLPVAAAAGGVPPGLLIYAKSWEFNGPLFEPLWRLLDGLDAAPRLADLLDTLKVQTNRHDFFNHFYPYLYPQFLAKVVLGLALVGTVLLARPEPDPAAATGRLLGRALLLSATVYPWYLLWVLPWAALRRHPAWLGLSALLPLSYLAQPGGMPLFPWLWLAIWGPFFALLWAGPGWSRA